MGKTFLLTGATGDLGSELLSRLLTADLDNIVYCMIRQKDNKSEDERLSILLNSMGIPAQYHQRVSVIAGDVCKDVFGMELETYNKLAQTVNVIIHCAADVRFNQKLENIRKCNVEGVRRILDFARLCNHEKKLELVAYVGTAFVAGCRKGIVLEEELSEIYGFNNSYEQTKYEAELLVREYISEGFAAIVFRPSIIMGGSSNGAIKKTSLLYPLIVLLKDLLPSIILPYSKSVEIDIVPMDFVVDSMVYIINDESNFNRCYHLAAGPGATIDVVNEMIKGIIEILDIKNVRFMPRFIWGLFIPFWKYFNKPLYKRIKKLKKMNELSGYGNYGLNDNPDFSIENTKKALDGSQIGIPNPRGFLRASIEYAKINYFSN